PELWSSLRTPPIYRSRNSSAFAFFLLFVGVVIGRDDAADEFVAHDIGAGELDLCDFRDPAQERRRLDEAGALPGRQVDLRRIAGDDHVRMLAEPRQEHFHL